MWESMKSWMLEIVGSQGDIADASLWQVGVRAVLIYLIGLVIVRVGKSRLVSRTTTLDIIVAFILGSLLSRGITGDATVSSTAIAAAAIVACHWLLTWATMDSRWLGRFWKGVPVRLIENGHVIPEAMKHSHISERDLEELLRLNAGVEDVSRVKVAYKERNGDLGVVLTDPEPRVIDVKVAEGVQTVRIQLN